MLLRCRLLGGARRFGAHGGGERRGRIVAAAHLQRVRRVSRQKCAFGVRMFTFKFNHMFASKCQNLPPSSLGIY